MPKIEITRTELVWPGKYDEDGELVPPRRVNLPFQVIERVNETRATREKREEDLAGHTATLFDYWQADEQQMAEPGDGWRNKLIWGDNLYVMGSLLEHFAGKIDLIYIDPPFATGTDFSFRAELGDTDVIKEQSLIEEKAYRDTWGRGLDSYLQIMYERLLLMRDLLADTGAIYIHCDWHVGHSLKLLCDEVFGGEWFRNEIIWKRTTSHSDAAAYGSVHDTILFYASRGSHQKNEVLQDYDPEYIEQYYRYTDENGRRFMSADLSGAGDGPPRTFGDRGKIIPPRGRHWMYDQAGIDRLLRENRIYWTRNDIPRLKKYLDESPGMPAADVWIDIQALRSWHKDESTGYATQKPEDLLERIVEASSNAGDLVADFFSGSGTTPSVAEKLRRRWISCDLSRYAIHTTRKRLMDIPDCGPFEILNLGQYERQVWQGVTFGGERTTRQVLLFDYLKFILNLYGAQPLAGTQHIHGKKGSALVHVGAVDAPVTIDEINDCLDECKVMQQKELHVLGWEWEMGLANNMVDVAKAQGIRLLLLTIPREVMEQQAVDKGDIRFYELAYMEVDINPSRKKHSYTVTLTDFVIPNDELIPEEVREKVRKWSDYVDYWAVDWDFRSDTFVNGWTSYRTGRDRSLKLKTEPHVYDEPGNYRIMVKVIDIFGNDTSQVFDLEVT